MKPRPDLQGVDWPSKGEESLFEITVTSHLRPSMLPRSQQHPLAAASEAEKGKMRKYSQLATEENKYLYVLAFEVSGAFGHGVSFLLSKLATRYDSMAFDATAEDRTWASHSWKQYWTQRLACTFWRGSSIMFQKNAAAERGRLPRIPPSAEDEDEDEVAQGYSRAAGPKMGCSFFQAPPLHYRQAQLFREGSAAAQQQPTPSHHAGASPSAATTAGHHGGVAQAPHSADGAREAAARV